MNDYFPKWPAKVRPATVTITCPYCKEWIDPSCAEHGLPLGEFVICDGCCRRLRVPKRWQ